MSDGIDNDLLPPALHANNEALEWLDRLARLATGGDSDAVRMFHDITCGMVARLHELHLDHAASVLQWPVLLPQDRTARNAVTKLALEMRIGSVMAGRSRPEILAYDSEKGFAVQNLRRMSFARAVLQSTCRGRSRMASGETMV